MMTKVLVGFSGIILCVAGFVFLGVAATNFLTGRFGETVGMLILVITILAAYLGTVMVCYGVFGGSDD